MDRITAVLDACVLYPAPLRDLLLHLALEDLFQPRWTEAIHEEWMRAVLETRPDLRREQLERTRDLMNAHAADSLVVGYEELIPGLDLPDPADRHVLAAAIHCGAEAIITFNLKHFPAAALATHGISAIHPDEFVGKLLDAAPLEVCAAARRQRLSLKRPPKTVDEFLETLGRQGLPTTVQRLRAMADLL